MGSPNIYFQPNIVFIDVDNVFRTVEALVEQERYVFQFELVEKLKNVLQSRDVANAALIEVVEYRQQRRLAKDH
ncbi:hypothetical protein LCGC14_2088110, partial [marine sediment metagenome]